MSPPDDEPTGSTGSRVAGLVLAAGAGRRMGAPKALLRGTDGTPFVNRAVDVLRSGGCDPVVVVVGAAAEEVSALAAESDAAVVPAPDWAEGMGASLRAGLSGLPPVDAAVVMLVDLPDVGTEVVRRLLASVPAHDGALARAAYDGLPGHPVLLGREHFAGVLEVSRGDRGARDYLAGRDVVLVECGDLATGRDTDRPADLP